MSNSYNLKFRTKTIKVAAYLEVIGFDIEVESDAINANGEALMTTEPADRAEQAVAEYCNGATVPAQALLDAYTSISRRVRAVRQQQPDLMRTQPPRETVVHHGMLPVSHG